jgi:hypothetical protein
MSLSLFAFTIALSKDSDISRTASTAHMKKICPAPASVPVEFQPSHAPATRPRIVTTKAHVKYLYIAINHFQLFQGYCRWELSILMTDIKAPAAIFSEVFKIRHAAAKDRAFWPCFGSGNASDASSVHTTVNDQKDLLARLFVPGEVGDISRFT